MKTKTSKKLLAIAFALVTTILVGMASANTGAAQDEKSEETINIALLNPDHYRTLKAGWWPSYPDYEELENRTVCSRAYSLDGDCGTGSGADVGTQPDFLEELLTGQGYNVDVFSTTELPALSPSDYDLVIIQDPLTEVNKAWNFSRTDKTPDLLEIFKSSTTRDNVLNYYKSGGRLLLVGDAVRLLEDEKGDGIYTLNFGKEVETKQTENNIPFDGYGEPRDGWIIDNWVLTIGSPFCCADRSASATYYATSSSWSMTDEVVGKISLFDGHDLTRQAFSDTLYFPADAVSLVDVHVTGSGNFDLNGFTCSPTVYTYDVDDHLNNFMGYTECGGGRIYYLGSDSYWDYKFITYAGAWHCGQSMYIDFDVTSAGESAFLNLVEDALNYNSPSTTPTVTVTTDKTTYTAGDTMNVEIEVANPTEDRLALQWWWLVPQYSVCVPVTPIPVSIPAGYDETLEYSFAIPNWGATGFGNVFYVQLAEEAGAGGAVLDVGTAGWIYSPSREAGTEAMSVEEANIANEIKRTVERIG